ncbi:DEAD/DEAH box helicase [Cellulomonas fimi]|uniref:DEAD/DEAH box helicase n=1 Tax=Cellulomonas fimi TaxID=1708 RepID=A0A7Y0LY76_CELFI|nr:DEAD/DEAH box helicase [Cellulomonas fimi]NMR20260.1 DEAD/DEAH box helicase [Cellulomonas fimi]
MTGRSVLHPALEYHVVNSLGWQDLRPLQRAAVAPILEGRDTLLIAPTAGGKTEAAVFPTLSRMVAEDWHGVSVLYVTPLRALLNNLHPRLEAYAAWLGRTVGLWHGDVGAGERRRILSDRPDILLTTPESLEAMLVSRRVDHRALLGGVRAVVIDELHAFAGDDRGWHLLAVLERIQRVAGRPLQRIGLSATVGNPDEMLRWLQGGGGGGAGSRPREVVTEATSSTTGIDVTVDYVGSVENAAEVISRLHHGEKRLVFCEARRVAEELAYALRERGVTTYVSHSSLSADERRQSERAFAEDRDCVIVATSTLELGVDIGDLDRVIQLDAPRSVASFLQRLGRTGRRPGASRSMLFLATEPPHLLRALGVLHLWRQGFVEPVEPPAAPRHILAQQLLALALQEGRLGTSTWPEWFGGLAIMADGDAVLEHLRRESFLVEDGGLLFIGPAAEREFGRRYFMDLLSSFTSAWEMRVVAGRREIGTVSPMAVTGTRPDAQKHILLAGRAWLVESIDWERHEILVSEQPQRAKVRWPSEPVAESFDLVRAQRDVLLGANPSVTISRRASARLAALRDELAGVVDDHGTVLIDRATGSEWWTWAGWRANETLIGALGASEAAADNLVITLPSGVGARQIRDALLDGVLPRVTQEAVDGLKFSAALPLELATATLAERDADTRGAAAAQAEGLVIRAADG